jgi:hypothetical protein
MSRAFAAVLLSLAAVALAPQQALAFCAVYPFYFPYFGSNTSTTMDADSGKPCPIAAASGGTAYMQSVTVAARPRNGSVSIGAGYVVTYQSRPGYTGPDSFAYAVRGSAPSGTGTSIVRVNVRVR